MLLPRNESFSPAMNGSQAHSKAQEWGTPGEERQLPAICLLIHSTLGSSCCPHPCSKMASYRGMARKRRQGSQREGTSWGHFGYTQGELSKVMTGRPRPWPWMELHMRAKEGTEQPPFHPCGSVSLCTFHVPCCCRGSPSEGTRCADDGILTAPGYQAAQGC